MVADGEADEFGGGDEQSLVRAAAGPHDLGAGQGPVDLLAVVVGEAVEQGRMAPAEVGERLDHRGVGPRPLDRRRRAVPDAEPELPGPPRDRGQQRRLADPRGPGDDQRAAPPRGRVDQRSARRRPAHGRARRARPAARPRRRGRRAGDRAAASASPSRGDAQLAPQGRSRRSNCRSAAWRSPFAAWRRISATWATSSPGSSSTTVVPPAVEAQQLEVAETELLPAFLGPLARSGPGAAARRRRGRARGGPRRRRSSARARRASSSNCTTSTVVCVRARAGRCRRAARRRREGDGPSGEVRGLVQLRDGLVEGVVGPHQVEELLAVQPPAGRERQDLHERGSVASGPAGLGRRDPVDRERELAEQGDLAPSSSPHVLLSSSRASGSGPVTTTR